MDLKYILERFKPTKKKIILSIIIAFIVNILYWLIIATTNLYDIIKPVIEWYIENIASMLFSISGIVILLVIFLVIYITWSLKEKK